MRIFIVAIALVVLGCGKPIQYHKKKNKLVTEENKFHLANH